MSFATLMLKNLFRQRLRTGLTILGSDLSRHRARHVGMVFQLHNLLPNLTAVENVTTQRPGGSCST